MIVKRSVMVSNVLTTLYAGFALLALSLLLDVALAYKVVIFCAGCMALFQAYRFKIKYERDEVYGGLLLIIPSTVLTILGVYFLVLSMLFTDKNDILPVTLFMAIRIIAGLSVVGLVSFGISIFIIGVSDKKRK
jgi:hypothetical protein